MVDGNNLRVVYGHSTSYLSSFGHGVAVGTAAVESLNVGHGIVGQGIVYGGRQLVNSIVFNGRSIVIDGTVYDGTHCTHNGYVYDARYVGGFPTVFGYPVGYGVYNGYNVFSDDILFDGSSFVIGGRSFAGTHVVHSGFEYNGYLLNNLRVVYGFSTSYLSSFGHGVALGYRCPAGQVYKECGTACPATCGNLNPVCAAVCVADCCCPDGEVYLDASRRQCIPENLCPATVVDAIGDAIGTGCWIELFEGPHFTGKSWTFTEDKAFVEAANDRCGSLYVPPGCEWTLYADVMYGDGQSGDVSKAVCTGPATGSGKWLNEFWLNNNDMKYKISSVKSGCSGVRPVIGSPLYSFPAHSHGVVGRVGLPGRVSENLVHHDDRIVRYKRGISTMGVGLGYGGIVYGGRQLVNSIVFNGRSIVIDGTVYEGTHCTHNGYVYDARYVGGFPTVFGYPVGYGVYNGYNVFSDNILFDGSNFVIGGRSFAGTHVVHSGFEYNGYLLNNLRVVYGFSTSYLSSFGHGVALGTATVGTA